MNSKNCIKIVCLFISIFSLCETTFAQTTPGGNLRAYIDALDNISYVADRAKNKIGSNGPARSSDAYLLGQRVDEFLERHRNMPGATTDLETVLKRHGLSMRGNARTSLLVGLAAITSGAIYAVGGLSSERNAEGAVPVTPDKTAFNGGLHSKVNLILGNSRQRETSSMTSSDGTK